MDSGVVAAVAVGAAFGVSVVAGRLAAVGSSVAAGVTAATGWADACAVVLAVGWGEERPTATLGDACSRGEFAPAPSQAKRRRLQLRRSVAATSARELSYLAEYTSREALAGQAAFSAIALCVPPTEAWRVGGQLHGLWCDRRPQNSSE